MNSQSNKQHDVVIRRRSGLATRMIAMGILVATVVAVVATAAAFPLIRGTAEATARGDLARLADLTTATVQERRDGRFVVPPQVASSLRAQNVSAYVLFAGAKELPAGLTDADVEQVLAGESLSATAEATQGEVLIEGRPLQDQSAVFLVQPSSVVSAPTQTVLLRFAGALLLGIAVSIVVAVLVAQRVTRPLRRAADAADLLGSGERDVQIIPEGPAEVARILDSLNRLSGELTTSEGRQREFLLSVSHELRTPLTAVRGYAEALVDGLVPAHDLPRVSQLVVSETQRLERLVADLLDLARLGAVDFHAERVRCDVSSVITQAQAHWQDRCGRLGVQLSVEVAADLVAVADAVRLRQAIDNLTENALRVTGEGQRIRWRALAATGHRGESEVVVEVSDSGPGLSADDAHVAFEPGVLYERYRGVRKVGTGLGLAIVGRLAAAMGGTASAGSSDLGGASFTIRLPAATAEALR